MRVPILILIWVSWVGTGEAAQFQSGQTPQHVVAADFNRDNFVDLAVANAFDDTVAIHLQGPEGVFPISQSLRVGINPSALSNFPRFLLVEDLNRDFFPDLIVLCSGQFSLGAEPSVQSLLNNGDGGFARLPASPTTPSYSAEEFPVQFVQGEFTGDSYADLALANLEDRSVRILNGNGTGAYQVGQRIDLNTAGEGPQDLAVFDQDSDGLDDLWAVTGNAFVVLRQSAAGVIAPSAQFPLSVAPVDLRALVLDDLDGDGGVDAALADAEGRVHILYNIDVAGASSSTDLWTDPSLSGCSDLATVFWDGDPIPDVAVSNRTGDSVTVFLSTGAVQVYSTGRSPRRVEAMGDLDGDGRVDLGVANEGDLTIPLNPDVNIEPNPGDPVPVFSLTPGGEWMFEEAFELNVPAARALAIPDEEERFWLLDSTRRTLVETDPNGSLRRSIPFPFEIGGVHFKEDEEGYVVERHASRIHEFKIEDGPTLEIEETKTFSFNPGEVGFSGLAFDEGQEEFYVSTPGTGQVLRLDDDGDILSQISVSIPAWDLAWDRDRQRLLAVNPGRSDLRAYTSVGTLDVSATEDLAGTSAYFKGVGLSGVTWRDNGNEVYLMTTSGTLFRWNLGSLDAVVPVAPAAESLGMDFDLGRGELHGLSGAGFVYSFDTGDYTDGDLFSIWTAMLADPAFVPTGLAFDPTTDRILICDKDNPRAAQFSRSGDFLGFRDFTPSVGALSGPLKGFDLEPSGPGVCMGTPYTLRYGPPSEAVPFPGAAIRDVVWSDQGVFLTSRNPGETLFFESPDSVTLERVKITDGGSLAALAVDALGNLLTLSQNNPPQFRLYQFELLSSVDHWNLLK